MGPEKLLLSADIQEPHSGNGNRTYVHSSKVGKVFSPFLAGTEEPFTYPLTVHATAS